MEDRTQILNELLGGFQELAHDRPIDLILRALQIFREHIEADLVRQIHQQLGEGNGGDIN